MGKETNSLTLTDVLGPLAQSAERGADNAKVVSSTLTRTNKHKNIFLFFCERFFLFVYVFVCFLFCCAIIFLSLVDTFF